jgi:hypothetical protein
MCFLLPARREAYSLILQNDRRICSLRRYPNISSVHGKAGQHQLSESDVRHVRNAILIEKYQSMYDSHDFQAKLMTQLLHKIIPHRHHEAIIDTSFAKSPSLESLTEAEKVDRSLYALWKIRQVNHHFFPPSEQAVLDNREMRIARFAFKYSFMLGVAGYTAFNIYYSRLTLKRVAFVVTTIAALRATLFGIEVFYDKAKMPSRRSLARKYMDAYGSQQLYEISLPTYPTEKLAHLHNILQ